MSHLKAVIFDVDGTLAETERDGHRVAFNRAFDQTGLDWFWDEAIYGQLLSVTGGKERLRYYLTHFEPTAVSEAEMDTLITELHAAKTEHYVALLEQREIGLRPGVQRLLNEINEQGLKLAIATTTTPANVTALIGSTLGEEAVNWFDVIAAGDVVEAKKPAADIFHYCLHRLGLSPEQCIAIEDSENGLRAALGASLTTLVTINTYTETEDFSGAVSVVNHLGDVHDPVQTLSGKAIDTDIVTVDVLRDLHAYDKR